MAQRGADELVFLPLGGVGEIGMNMGLYGFGPPDKRQWLMVDCGVTFGDPAETPGVDLILPDIRFIEADRSNLLGIVLTHAHEDHYGAVLDLWPRLKAPLVATPFAANLLEAKRQGEHGMAKVPVKVVPPGGRITLGPFDIELVPVAHSIPEAVALAIRTPLGTVLHTGDWKIDPTPILGQGTDEKRLREIGEEGVLAMVADSTNATREGRSPSEREIGNTLVDLIRSAPARVAITTFASHIPRIRLVAEAAQQAGREVVIVGRAMERTINVARETGWLDGLDDFRSPDVYGYLPPEKVVLILTGSQGEARAALARIASDTHPEITLSKNDRLIFSSRTIPGNEKGVNRIINGLIDRGVEVITDRTHQVHVSGHPRRGEIAELYSWVKPQMVLPVHGESLHLHEHADLARSLGVPHVVNFRNGDMVRLAPGAPEVVDDAPTGRLYKDGRLLTTSSDAAVTERKRLAFGGVISVALAVTSKGELVGEPDVQIVGLPQQDAEGDTFIEIVRDTVLDTWDSLASGRRRDVDFVANAVERAVRAEVNRCWGKKPSCHIHVLAV